MKDAKTMSIIKASYEKNKVKIYYDELPESFEVPSMYFPVPEEMSGIDSTSGFSTTLNLYAKVFEASTNLAYEKAAVVARAFIKESYKIPIVNFDGKYSGESFCLKEVSASRLDDRVAQLKFVWKVSQTFESVDVEIPKYTDFTLDAILKYEEGDL